MEHREQLLRSWVVCLPSPPPTPPECVFTPPPPPSASGYVNDLELCAHVGSSPENNKSRLFSRYNSVSFGGIRIARVISLVSRWLSAKRKQLFSRHNSVSFSHICTARVISLVWSPPPPHPARSPPRISTRKKERKKSPYATVLPKKDPLFKCTTGKPRAKNTNEHYCLSAVAQLSDGDRL